MIDYTPNYYSQKNYVMIGQKALIFNDAGEILLLQRSKKMDHAGKWSLAGGGLEKNETPMAGIQREIEEETQLVVEKLQPFTVFSYHNKDKELVVMIGYVCQLKSGEVTLNCEHDDFKWVTKEMALQMDLSEHARLVINNYLKRG